MITLCTEKNRKDILTYLYEEASYNIFPIGDIEHFGFDSPFQHVYAEFNSQNDVQSVFLQYRENAIYYSKEHHFNQDYLPLLDEHSIDYISAKSDLADLFAGDLPHFTKKRMYFCSATSKIPITGLDFSTVQMIQTEQDCEKLYDLIHLIDEFGASKVTKEHFVEAKLKGLEMGCTIYIEEDGKIVSTAATTAETTKNAMIIAVATDPDYRQKGYASLLMQYMMNEYINKNDKELCLFYNNPKAGAIYLRLGFEYMGTWDMFQRGN